jgi:hypothetical protein
MSRNILEIADESPAVTIDAVADIDELATHLSSLLPPPGRVTNVNIYCSRDTPGRMLCLVDVLDMPAADAATALGGVPFAFTAVVLDITLPISFSCRTGRPGKPAITNCNCSSGARPSLTTRLDA